MDGWVLYFIYLGVNTCENLVWIRKKLDNNKFLKWKLNIVNNIFIVLNETTD
jgi:hypothetical protein